MNATDSLGASGGQRAEPADSPTGQFLYETFYGGAIGGSAIALVFLVIDSLAGRPLFTPSLIGTALFTGAEAAAVTEVRLDMVAYYSVTHFTAFLVLGALVSKMCRRTGLSTGNPMATLVLVFVVLTAAFLGGEAVAMPGVSAVIGLPWVLLANAITAAAMALFFKRVHAEG